MGSYQIDEEGYLHCTIDGWITTTRPLEIQDIRKFERGLLTDEDLEKYEWECDE